MWVQPNHDVVQSSAVAFPTMIFMMHRRGIAHDDPPPGPLTNVTTPRGLVLEPAPATVRDRR
jgi:hypothetical protein